MAEFAVRNKLSMFCLAAIVAVMFLTGCGEEEQSLVYPAGDSCSVDVPIMGEKFSRETPIILKGWAADLATGTIPAKVEVYLVPETRKGGIKALLNRDLPRQDVADYFKKPHFVNSGITGKLDISSLSPGNYHFVVMQTDGQRKLFCFPPVVINIQ
jgi:hypothetical protein